MDKIVLKQTVHPNLNWMIAYPLLLVCLIIVYNDFYLFYTLLVPLVLISFGFDFVLVNKKKSYISCNFFGVSIFKKSFIKPDYISLFEQSFTRSTNNGVYPQMLGFDRYSLFIIKFCNDCYGETIFESNSKEEVFELGKPISVMFDVRLHNALD